MRNLRLPALAAATLGLMLTFGAQAQDHAPNMHRPQVTGEMSNSEIAASYKAEAAELRERAATHRKMATHFKGRNTMGGKLNFSNTISHCNKLADQYEGAAKEADAIVAEMSK
jgi:hypothetical protein